ncbi:MAG: hypothetical protein V1855_03375, partial [bacterium]
RDIYYELLNIQETLKATLSYLKETLFSDFDIVIQTTKKQIENTKNGIKKLEEKGQIIKNRSKRVEELKLKEIQDLEQAAKEQVAGSATTSVELEKAAKKPIGVLNKIYNFFVNLIAKIYKFIKNIFSSTKVTAQEIAAKRLDVKTTSTTSIQAQPISTIQVGQAPQLQANSSGLTPQSPIPPLQPIGLTQTTTVSTSTLPTMQ